MISDARWLLSLLQKYRYLNYCVCNGHVAPGAIDRDTNQKLMFFEKSTPFIIQ